MKSPSKNCVIFTTKLDDPLREFIRLRDNCYVVKESLDGFEDKEKCVRIAAKKKCDFFVTYSDKFISFGRLVGLNLLDLYKFKIESKESTISITKKNNSLPPELNSRFLVATFNTSEKMNNLFIHLLGSKIDKIDLSAIEYAFILDRKDEIYSFRYVRVDDDKFTEIGPSFKMSLVNDYFDDEVAELTRVVVKKEQKNVSKTVTKDTVGRVYIEKQDLKDVKVRKSVKNK